jgi:hypothetical protein
MPESIYQIPGNTSSESESFDVLKNLEVRDKVINSARDDVHGSYSREYIPTPEARGHIRIIDLASRFHDAHRKSVASDYDKAA